MDRIFRYLLRFKRFSDWINSTPQMELDKSKLSTKMKIGLFLIGFSFLVHWLGWIITSAVAGILRSVEIAAIGLPGFYILSWFVWGAGMLLTGKANYDYGRFFLARYIKKKYLSDSSNG